MRALDKRRARTVLVKQKLVHPCFLHPTARQRLAPNKKLLVGRSPLVGMMTVAGWSSLYEDNPLAVWAAVGATVILAPLSTFLLGKAAKKAPPPFLSASAWREVTLVEKRSASPSVRRLTCGPARMCLITWRVPARAAVSSTCAAQRSSAVSSSLTSACSVLDCRSALSCCHAFLRPGRRALLPATTLVGHL